MTAPEKAIFVLSLAAALAASASGASIERPSTVVKTADGWRIVYALGSPVKVDYFTLSNAPAGAWSLTVDSWEFARGEKLPENLSTNLPKAVSASRFQFEVKGDADPKMGGLLLETADLSDRAAVEALRRLYVEKKGDRIFADFGGETAVRGVYVPAGSSVEVYGSWSPSLADGGLGSPILASRTEKDGRLYVEFHDVQRFCYFAVTGVDAPKDIEFDVVPYDYAKHLTGETWEQKLARMKWWTDARFGMFIHFGLYAVPARHEWVKSNERISDEQYREYFETFNPSRFDAKAWAKAAKGGELGIAAGGVAASSASPVADAPAPVVKGISVDGDYVYVTITSTKPAFKYTLETGATPDSISEKADADAGFGSETKDIILVSPKKAGGEFFKVNCK